MAIAVTAIAIGNRQSSALSFKGLAFWLTARY
jgi:hypothetical protein